MCWTLGKLFFDLNFGLRRDCAWLTGGGIDCHQDNWGWRRHLLAHPGKLFVSLARFFLLAIFDPRKWWDTYSSVIWPAAPEQEREHGEGADVDATAGDGAEDSANLDPVDENLWWKFKGTNQADKDEDHRLPCSKVRDWIKRQSLLFSGWGELLERLSLFSITCSRERGRRQSWTRSKQRRVFSPQQTRRGPPPARRRQAWISSWKFRVVWKDLKAKDHAYDGPKATEHQRVLLQFDLLPKKSWFKFWGVFSSISDNLKHFWLVLIPCMMLKT